MLAILSGGTGWHVQDLLRAAKSIGVSAAAVDFRSLWGSLDGAGSLSGFDRIIVRTMPAGSLEQVIVRMDLLHAAEANGQVVVNPPRALECCVDKYLTSIRLARAGLPTPRTVATQSLGEAMAAFDSLGGDVVVKPIFGSEGRGIVRLTDHETAWRTFHAIATMQDVIYMQEYIHHPGHDLRAFVVRDRIIAAMQRSNHRDFRTNVAQGGVATRTTLSSAEEKLAIAAAAATGAIIAGVDLLPGPTGMQVIEVNAVPGWQALAEVTGHDIARTVIETVSKSP
jgi:RimK family alpha-L-glutamate ligase